MVIRKDYEIAKYHKITSPLIELSDSVVTVDNFKIPTENNLFLQLIQEKHLKEINERFISLVKSISSII